MAEETLKQRQERLMAECLMKALGLRLRSVRPCDPPSADVSLELVTGEVIALEVRGLTDPGRRESMSTKQRIGLAAEAALQGVRVNAHVGWESEIVIPSKDGARLGEEIARAVREMLTGGRMALGDLDVVPEVLEPYVAAIHLFPPERDGPHVHTSLESWEGCGSTEVVQSALDEKEAKLASYRQAHPDTEVWLVLWTSAGESQPVTIRMLDSTHVYNSGFDRAFLLDYPRCEAMELKLTPVE